MDALLTTTQTYLTPLASALPSGALAIGDHYLDQTGQVTRATSAMRITPQFRLNSSVEQHDGIRCVTLCTATGIGEASSADGWALLAPVAPTWRYTTPARQVVISDGPTFPIGAMPFNTIPLRVGWSDGAWQKPTAVFGASQTDPVICPTGVHALSVVQLPTEGLHYQWPVAASTADLGCLYAGSEMDVVTGAPSSPMALVLYRAGALIAVNEQAHQIFPKLPLTSAHESAAGAGGGAHSFELSERDGLPRSAKIGAETARIHMDDSDFEVTELTRPPAHHQARLPTILGRRLTVRERIARVAAIVCLLIVALAPLLAIIASRLAHVRGLGRHTHTASPNTIAAWSWRVPACQHCALGRPRDRRSLCRTSGYRAPVALRWKPDPYLFIGAWNP